ncbi:flavodoxin domain-containing protein [Inconstantimicrobium mannanitabidum]|uniref:Flavodoxin n=1 Tax=Inconstantimicrobium mannanitabidum TaxID=1604901 RepID=A0ACB5R8H6_9CLOT|nr:flavodoxin domain-containing protein [Clostridium sp. TW13]GKX65442.1 flavodoxin [Clostridium sp. TW13]
MKKISIIYWSCGGAVETLAKHIKAVGVECGAEVLMKHVQEASIDDVINADAVALGSPVTDGDKIEQQEMQPFVDALNELKNDGKKMMLFGSCGWNDATFIHKWAEKMTSYGFNVIGELPIKDSSTEDDFVKCTEFVRELIN